METILFYCLRGGVSFIWMALIFIHSALFILSDLGIVLPRLYERIVVVKEKTNNINCEYVVNMLHAVFEVDD